MSNSNANNRCECGLHVGVVSADKRIVALVATKKVRVHKASIIDTTAIAASGADYVSLSLLKNNVAIGTPVTTIAGVAARTEIPMDLDGDYLDLEKGDVLEALLDIEAGGALTMVNVQMDIETIGN